MDFKELVSNRYSVRNFNSNKIDNETIDNILNFARLAPSAKNSQPYKVYVIRNEKLIDNLKVNTKSITNCKNLLLITTIDDEVWINKRRGNVPIGDIDVGIFASYIILAALDFGVGSCIIGMFDDKDIRDNISIPANETPSLLISLGYISEDSTPSEEYHYKRKSLDEIVYFID